ncbi:MAG: restriction modification system specificity domain protein [Gemmataceae bacterium]|nr:restriction modification system specificity domain protein [Gemmataceae bacterium]
MSADWPRVPLGEVLKLQRRWVKLEPTETYFEIGVRSFGNGIFHKAPVTGQSLGDKRVLAIEPGDLVLNNVFAWEGAVAVAGPAEAGKIGSHRFVTSTPDQNRCTTAFFRWFFVSEPGLDVLRRASPGSAGRNRTLNLDQFFAAAVPLPPLTEQRRIVARVEAVAGRVAEARRLREEAKKEATALLAASLGRFFEAAAMRIGTRTLGELSVYITDGPHVTPTYVLDGVPFVTVKNMVTGKLTFDDLKYITPTDHAEFVKRCHPERGDVLYSKDGATRGWPCIVDTDREFSIFVSVALIKMKRDLLDGEYLCYVLRSSWIRDRMHTKSRGDMIPHIVLREIKEFPIPLPPLPEQRRIVAHLDALQAKVDALRTLQAETAAELDALLPAVLAKAFAGEL